MHGYYYYCRSAISIISVCRRTRPPPIDPSLVCPVRGDSYIDLHVIAAAGALV